MDWRVGIREELTDLKRFWPSASIRNRFLSFSSVGKLLPEDPR